MEKVSIPEVVERFGSPVIAKFFYEYGHLNETDIKYQVMRNMFQEYEEVEGGGAETSYYILGKKRVVPIENHQVSLTLVYEVDKTRLSYYPAEFYKKGVGFVYLATNKHTGEIYVGSTKRQLSVRINEHKSTALQPKSKNYNTKVNTAIRIYGFHAFEWKILDKVQGENVLKEVEDEWIEKLDAINKGYNNNRSYRKKVCKVTHIRKKNLKIG